MSLTQSDLQKIRIIIHDEVSIIVRNEVGNQLENKFEPLKNEIRALRNDIHEIYDMISDLQTSTITDKKFNKLTLEKKLLTLNAELLATAKQAGVTLPRS
jgi:DNA mismatch repair protein MutH